MIIDGYDGARRIYQLQEELLDRDADHEDRAEVELIKTVALCAIEQHLASMSRLLHKRGGGDW